MNQVLISIRNIDEVYQGPGKEFTYAEIEKE